MKKVLIPQSQGIHKDDATPQTPLEEEGRTGYTHRVDPGLDPIRIRRRGRRITERSDALGR